jgi:hypothetical protein
MGHSRHLGPGRGAAPLSVSPWGGGAGLRLRTSTRRTPNSCVRLHVFLQPYGTLASLMVMQCDDDSMHRCAHVRVWEVGLGHAPLDTCGVLVRECPSYLAGRGSLGGTPWFVPLTL